jgi:hypothetical protein
VVDLDWDNLIILDGCRADVFEEAWSNDIPGNLSVRIASNSASRGFLFDNFLDRQFHDTVYVTGNAWVNVELEADTFHDVISVWKDGWDEELGTVPPEAMRDAALNAAEQYPDKRLIIHFMQPHSPFIGDHRIINPADHVSLLRKQALGEDPGESDVTTPGEFKLFQSGQVSHKEMWQAYRSNLEVALPAVEKLLKQLTGRTAVTADHGEAFGEWAFPFPIRIYGHPSENLPLRSLVRVPWFVSNDGKRKKIVEQRNKESSIHDSSDRIARERLQHLGYREA